MPPSIPLNIVYVGPMTHGGTCLQRMNAMGELGHKITPVDILPADAAAKERLLYNRIIYKFRGPRDMARANDQILQRVKTTPVDVLWIDKGLTIRPETLRAVKQAQPKCRIVGYSPDDMASRHNQTASFLKCLPLFDIYFTTKTYGVAELTALKCPRVEFIGNAYDRNVHRPMDVTADDRARLGGPVGFIGHCEEDRTRSMLFLAENGIPVRIWGTHWDRSPYHHKNLILECKGLWVDDYAKALCCNDINLAFLRKLNRDQQTQRTMEIPACGAFMLAERTDEHRALFEEGREAEYFSSDQELLDKTRYYLDHPDERARIAAAGRQRCLTSGYSNHDRIYKMLEIVRELPI